MIRDAIVSALTADDVNLTAHLARRVADIAVGIMAKPPNRLPAVTIPITLPVGAGKHDIAVSLAYDMATGHLREAVFVSRGKIGQDMDLMLHDLGIKLSRAIQGRDPETGEATEAPAA